jgi:hypothetical protein
MSLIFILCLALATASNNWVGEFRIVNECSCQCCGLEDSVVRWFVDGDLLQSEFFNLPNCGNSSSGTAAYLTEIASPGELPPNVETFQIAANGDYDNIIPAITVTCTLTFNSDSIMCGPIPTNVSANCFDHFVRTGSGSSSSSASTFAGSVLF